MDSDEEERKKPGPDPERLVIEEEPEKALDKLLQKPDDPEENPETDESE